MEAVELRGHTALVTGAYGLLGAWLTKALLQAGGTNYGHPAYVLPTSEHSAHSNGRAENFGFMSSVVSSEKPQALQVRQIAGRIRGKGSPKQAL